MDANSLHYLEAHWLQKGGQATASRPNLAAFMLLSAELSNWGKETCGKA